MKTTKKILALVMALMLVLSSVSVLADGAVTPCADDAHVWHVTEEVKATCKANGTKIEKCDVCGKTKTTTTLKVDHDWSAWTTKTAATCTADLVEKRTCAAGGETETRTVPNTKTGHTPVETPDTKLTKPATCKEAGREVGKVVCSVCGAGIDSYDREVKALKHDWTKIWKITKVEGVVTKVEYDLNGDGVGTIEVVADQTKAATCEEAGKITLKCKVCGVTESKDVPAIGHDYQVSAEMADKNTEATCTTDGKVMKTCVNCGNDIYETTKAMGHSFTGAVTYKQNGKVVSKDQLADCAPYDTITKCANCDETTVKTTPAATGKEHDYKLWIPSNPATCENAGYGYFKCATCGAVTSKDYDALGHSWDKGTVTTAPTCTEKGVKTYKCTVKGCTGTKTEELPAVGHNKTTDKGKSKAATCTKEGLKYEECMVCGAVLKNEVIPATHNKTNATVYAITYATCTEDGSITYSCATCGKKVEDEVIKATGHKYATTATQVTAATCTEPATEAKFCTNVGANGKKCEAHTAPVATGKALGHKKPAADMIYEATAATCTTTGSILYTCVTCNKPVWEDTKALGHNYETVKGADGSYVLKCSNCAETKNVTVADPEVAVSLADVTKTSKTTSGTGKVVATGVTEKIYARITWAYTFSNGESMAFVAMSEVKEDGSFKVKGPNAPSGATLNSVLVAVVTDADADEAPFYDALAVANK